MIPRSCCLVGLLFLFMIVTSDAHRCHRRGHRLHLDCRDLKTRGYYSRALPPLKPPPPPLKPPRSLPEPTLRLLSALGLPAITVRSAAIKITMHPIASTQRVGVRVRLKSRVMNFVFLPPIVGPSDWYEVGMSFHCLNAISIAPPYKFAPPRGCRSRACVHSLTAKCRSMLTAMNAPAFARGLPSWVGMTATAGTRIKSLCLKVLRT